MLSKKNFRHIIHQLRRNKCTVLDLSGIRLTTPQFNLLVRAIAQNTSLRALNLSYMRLHYSAIQQLVWALEGKPLLNCVNVFGNSISGNSVRVFRAIWGLSPNQLTTKPHIYAQVVQRFGLTATGDIERAVEEIDTMQLTVTPYLHTPTHQHTTRDTVKTNFTQKKMTNLTSSFCAINRLMMTLAQERAGYQSSSCLAWLAAPLIARKTAKIAALQQILQNRQSGQSWRDAIKPMCLDPRYRDALYGSFWGSKRWCGYLRTQEVIDAAIMEETLAPSRQMY
ncbi:MAG: hypothetical protein Tsb005_01680 [Gammaproteobacteria bacterium]